MSSLLRSLLVASLGISTMAFGSVALVGCAADTTEDGIEDAQEADDLTAESEEALTSTAKAFVTTWENGQPSGPDSDAYFATLTLKSDGKYTAEVADPRIRCIKAPCVLADSGTWNGYKTGGALKLRLSSTSRGRKIFDAKLTSSTLEISRKGTVVSFTKRVVAGCTVVRCTATTHCEDNNRTEPGRCVPNVTCANVRCASGTRCEDGGGTQAPQCVPVAACKRTGCSGQICADSDRVTTCEFRPEYACYQQAICERGSDGQCGFRKTAALTSCLAGN